MYYTFYVHIPELNFDPITYLVFDFENGYYFEIDRRSNEWIEIIETLENYIHIENNDWKKDIQGFIPEDEYRTVYKNEVFEKEETS